nr:EFR1 family ferrodoxin [uncultured Blautia sp.]
MILYFSATGNSKYVATRLIQFEKQELLSIVDCIRNDQYTFSDKTIGIISPTYDFGLPSIVKEFLERASFQTEYLYYIATYGTTPGASGAIANKAIQGRKIDAYYSVQMADTWTPIFDLSTPEKVAKYTKNTEAEISSIIRRVKERNKNRYMSPRTPAFITEWIAEPIYNNKVRCTVNFRVEDTCIGCSMCVRKCPVQAIEMQGKRPVWVKNKCVMCLGCLHRCPKFAIQYGKNTKKHGQYTNPNVTI